MTMKKTLLGLMTAVLMLPVFAQAEEITHSTVAVQGYDVVGYFDDSKAEKGNGNHVATYEGVNYLFASNDHKKEFEANPKKYLPVYGGWCAIGVKLGKKIISDPESWKIVDGKLYLNLNQSVQNLWLKDIPGNIKEANKNWEVIKDKNPSEIN